MSYKYLRTKSKSKYCCYSLKWSRKTAYTQAQFKMCDHDKKWTQFFIEETTNIDENVAGKTPCYFSGKTQT